MKQLALFMFVFSFLQSAHAYEINLKAAGTGIGVLQVNERFLATPCNFGLTGIKNATKQNAKENAIYKANEKCEDRGGNPVRTSSSAQGCSCEVGWGGDRLTCDATATVVCEI